MNELIKKLNKLNIRLELKGDNLDIQAPKGVLGKDLLLEIKAKKPELLNYLKNRLKRRNDIIPKIKESGKYVVSASQEGIWLKHQIDENKANYNMPVIYELKGNIDVGKLEKSFRFLIERHESLRTNFVGFEDGSVYQIISEINQNKFQFIHEDYKGNTLINDDLLLTLKKEIQYEFSLEKDSLYRLLLLGKKKDEYILSIVMHHIIGDAQSSELIIAELFYIYNTLVKNEPIDIHPLSIQYKDFAAWQKKKLESKELDEMKNYWKNQFLVPFPVLDIGSSEIDNVDGESHSDIFVKDFPTKLIDDFRKICERENATLFMGFLSIIKVLLYRYTGENEIVVGSPFSGRFNGQLQKLVGCFVNLLPLKSIIQGDDSFKSTLVKVKRVVSDALANQEYPYEYLVRELQREKVINNNAIFNYIISFEEYDNIANENIADEIEIAPFQMKGAYGSKFDLELNFKKEEEKTYLSLNYNKNKFNLDFINRLSQHIENLLLTVVDSPDANIENLEYMGQKELEEILINFNSNSLDYPREKTVVDLFEEQVAKNGDNLIVSYEGKYITYRELHEQSHLLIAFLIERYGLEREDVVGIKLGRTDWYILSILSILRQGCCYVPIDKEHPQSRVDFIANDSNCKLIIDDLIIEEFIAVKDNLSHLALIPPPNPTDLAYIIYTSGTTGKPKGVMVEHRNLMNLCFWHVEKYVVDEKSKGILYAGISFDASVWEIFPYIITGASLFPINNSELRLDVKSLASFLSNNKITHCFLPTIICQEMVRTDIEIKNIKVLTGGESLRLTKPPRFKLYNNYGPTENTVVATNYDVSNKFQYPLPIGSPVSNTDIYILDKNKLPLPLGMPGMIYLSGNSIARGYLNEPLLTAEKFMPNAITKKGRMYETGDMGKWLPDGNIVFLGRNDEQIKIRGHRIELGEIENVLKNYEGIDESTTILEQDKLITYIVVKEKINLTELRNYLKECLPIYMIPNKFVKLDEMPLNLNGKVDRKKLKEYNGEVIGFEVEHVSPRNETELSLVEIWSMMLKIEKEEIGVYDDFFVLGGDSLKAVALLTKVFDIFEIKIHLKRFLVEPNISNLAQELINANFYKKDDSHLDQDEEGVQEIYI